MENVDKKNIGLPSRYINALYELCDEAKNLKKITQDFEKFIKLVEDNKKPVSYTHLRAHETP